MGFHIDLNETPVPSPRETVDEISAGSGHPLCPVCRKGISVGRIPGKAVQESKCFRCLLKTATDAAESSGAGRGGGEVGRFDMNASPPLEPDDGDCVEVVAVRDGNGGGKLQAEIPSSFSHLNAVRQLNPVLDIGHFRQRAISAAGFHDMFRQNYRSEELHPARKDSTFDLREHNGHSTSSGVSPNMLYLQSLREYIAERSGVLGEGWHVDFEFCYKGFKTSAVYISPDGSRLKSMEDVAQHLGLMPRHQLMETGKGSGTQFALIQGGSKIDPYKKESSPFVPARNSRQRQRLSRTTKNQGFSTGTGMFNRIELSYDNSLEELKSSENGNHQDGIRDGFPIQFQDFFLISPGNVDPRPSYHNATQVWPVGYRSSWHDRITGSLFVCDVEDGGDSGPIFKVKRYPCTKQSIPVGSTVLSRAKPHSCKVDDKVRKDDLPASQVIDDDSISTITLLNEDSPPSLDNCLSTSKREGGIHLLEDNSSNSDLECLPQRPGNLLVDTLGFTDFIGEIQVEGRTTSSVWELVAQAFLYAYQFACKQKTTSKFFCGHDDVLGMNEENLDCADSLSRYGSFCGRVSVPLLVQNEDEFKIACEKLLAWLQQDRFGLDADFVQEIIEQLPGIEACSEYARLNNRRQNSVLQTVGSGFLQAERKTSGAFDILRRSQLKSGATGDALKRDLCPLGKPLNSKLPSYLMGDALQVWEHAWRFGDVLGLGLDFSFQELEFELVSPWIDSYPLKLRNNTGDVPTTVEKLLQAGSSFGRCNGLLTGKIIGSLLKVLVCELMSKAAAYVCPNFDTGESKSRRGRKKDLDSLAALKKTKLDMLPVNGLTWHEIARRYILAVLSMEGNLDSTEIASRESGKVFHCLQGDGGILCGSLTGIAALEADAMVLADAMKEIYGSLKGKNEIVSLSERESDADGPQTIEVNDSSIPEWAQVLEPVRKLPTNVGARIRRCINEALEKNPPEWAKKILEHSISKEVYKGNASGPTKRAVISVLAKVGSDNPLPRTEKKEKVKIKTSVVDLISKQCRIVLRQAASLDEDRVFCNLLSRIMLNPNDNDEDGLLGYPAMVSRPLDFRTIDLRLAAGAYGGTPEAFADDVREVWRDIHTAYGDRSDLIAVAEDLSRKFEDLYEKEVLTLVHKVSAVSNASDPNAEAVRERDDLLIHVCNTSLPRAPWEEGICKVCGMDKDDDNVLLCDKCDSEYHRYCLNPPLLKIPDGNWYCPSCVAGQSVSLGTVYGSASNQSRKRKFQGDFTRKLLDELARFANLMEVKEHWEFTIEERIFFMKFLFDEAVNSATIREHMEQCSSRVNDLQQKLRSLTSELKLLKVKEEILGLSTEKPQSGVHSGRGDLKSDASSSVLAIDGSSRGKPSEVGSHLSKFSSLAQVEHGSSSKEHVGHSKHPDLPPRSSKSLGSSDTPNQADQHHIGDHSENVKLPGLQQSTEPNPQIEALIAIQQQNTEQQTNIPRGSQGGSILSTSQVMTGPNLPGSANELVMDHVASAPMSSIHESHGHPNPSLADMVPSKDNSSKASTIKDDIVNLQNTIVSLESELFRVSIRKDYLGRDSNGRIYWAFHSTGARPWIVANGDLAFKNRLPAEFMGVPGSDKWMYYESDDEISKLVGWLSENHGREKEVRDAILQLQSNKLKDLQYTESHCLSKGASGRNRRIVAPDFFATKAMIVLETIFGPCKVTEATDVCHPLTSGVSQDGRMYRCECLELIWSAKDHCFSCHQTFPSNEELRQHSKENCKGIAPAPKKSQMITEDNTSKRKRLRLTTSQEKHSGSTGFVRPSTSQKQNNVSSFERYVSDTPFNFEEILTRFVVPGSVKDVVNEIGLIGSNGVPSFIPTRPPYLSDPALSLGSSGMNEDTSAAELPNCIKNQVQTGGVTKEANRSSRYAENALTDGTVVDRLRSALMTGSDQVPPVKEKGTLVGLSKGSIIRESSSRPVIGKGSEVLRLLKINLLDMDAALPGDALRASRTNQDKRRAWREFVKSSRSIYQIVQAMVVFEDTIKTDYLRNDWWYWSSPSMAAKITTLSALALRIFALDSAIYYDTLPATGATENSEPNSRVEEEAPSDKHPADPVSPPQQTPPEPDPADNPRTTRSRAAGKRKKDQSG